MSRRETTIKLEFYERTEKGKFKSKGIKALGFYRSATFAQFYKADEYGDAPTLTAVVNRNVLSVLDVNMYGVDRALYFKILQVSDGSKGITKNFFKVVRVYEVDDEFTELHAAPMQHGGVYSYEE